ncbi:Replication termination protein [Bacillus ginsengihumi]|uniref:Replication termination protein n=2 Tax=Heyndrickxia ginsengihumi TaxID=363870 RepID=A0A6M0PA93_9BACI|nr:Replication termination protein [Heyndrickxia ginsengihumi]
MMDTNKRESTGFLIKQRAFLKLYIITNIENGRWYGLKLLDELKKEFKPLGFEPQHSEVYRALHELEDEEEILTKGKVKVAGAKRKEVVVYKIKDHEKAQAYKKLVKTDLDRCVKLLQKALKDNF